MEGIVVWPEGLSVATAGLLLAVSLVTSALTAAVGLGGGLVLVAVMAAVLPPLAVVPVHGVVQLGSNLGRALVQRRHIDWRITVWFLGGSVVGAVAGGSVVVALPERLLLGTIGLFVIVMVWAPRPEVVRHGPVVFGLGGAVSSFLTMFIGATGPFAAAILPRQRLTKTAVVGTHAANMTAQHLLKIVVFAVLGFAFAPWLILIVGMIVTGFIGTLIGSHILKRSPDALFDTLFKGLLTVLGGNLLAQAAGWW